MKKFLLNLGIILSIAFIAFMFISTDLILLGFKEPVDFYGDDFDITEDHEGERIEADVPCCFGQAAVYTTTTKKNGTTTKRNTYFYVIPAQSPDDDYYFYIAVKVNEKDRSKFDALTTKTFNDEYGSLKLEGSLEKLDSEAYDYMLEYVEELYAESDPFESEEELKHYVLPLCFQTKNFSAGKTYIIIDICLFVGAVASWIGFFAIKSKENAKRAANQAAFQANFPGQSFEDNVVINGVPYPKHLFDSIDYSLNSGEKIAAIAKLREITGLGLAEAKDIIDNWNIYYN